jgi:hypothetical protein
MEIMIDNTENSKYLPSEDLDNEYDVVGNNNLMSRDDNKMQSDNNVNYVDLKEFMFNWFDKNLRITKNIYDIETPSCARALAFADFITDNAENQLSEVYYSIAIHIAKIYLYCGEEEGEAVYTEVTEPKDIYDIVSDAIEPEFNLYTQKLVANKSYTYETTLTYKCDKCGNEITTPIDIPSLVFLKAQRMGSGIE